MRLKVFVAYLLIFCLVFSFFVPLRRADAVPLAVPIAVSLADDVIVGAALALIAVGATFATADELKNSATVLYAYASTALRHALDLFPTTRTIDSQAMAEISALAGTWHTTLAGGGTVSAELPLVPQARTIFNQSRVPLIDSGTLLPGQMISWTVTAFNSSTTHGARIDPVVNGSRMSQFWDYLMLPLSTFTFFVSVRRSIIDGRIEYYIPSSSTWNRHFEPITSLGIGATNFIDWGLSAPVFGSVTTASVTPTTLTPTVVNPAWQERWTTANPYHRRMVGWPVTWPAVDSPGTLDTLVGQTAQSIDNLGDVIIPATVAPVTDVGWLQSLFDTVFGLGGTIIGHLTGITNSLGTLTGAVISFFDFSIPVNLNPLVIAGGTLTTRFPFSIPFDLAKAFTGMSAMGNQSPEFVIDINDGLLGRVNLVISLEQFHGLIQITRTFLLVMFVVGLILLTPKILRT